MIVFIEVLNKKYNEYIKKMEIIHIRQLRKVKPISKMDIAFVEGAISTPSEVMKIKKIREKAGKVIALGSGAITGWPSDLRNKFKGKKLERVLPRIRKHGQNEKILPLKEYIKVDGEIPGCPVNEELLIKKIDGMIGK